MQRKYIILPLILVLAISFTIYTNYRATNGITVEEISIQSQDRILRGLYVLPETSIPDHSLPGVVVFHGFSASKEMMRPFIEGLARQGFAVVAIDQQGHGLSEGRLGVPDDGLEIDGITTVRYLQSQKEVDTTRIGLVGHSMGGGVTLQVALALGNEISASVIIGNSLPDIEDTAANLTNPRNLLMAVGKYDELFDTDVAIATTSYLTGQTVEAGKLYGNFSDGSARKIIITSTDHIYEVLNPKIVETTMDWFHTALNISTTDDKADGTKYILDQLVSTISALLWISLLPTSLLFRKSEHKLEEKSIPWISHGAFSFLAFLLGSSAIILAPSNFALLFTGWMTIGGILFLWKNRKPEENLVTSIRRQFKIDISELRFTGVVILLLFIIIQFCLYLVHWDFRYVLPILNVLSLRRFPLFLMLFVSGIFFFSTEIIHIGGSSTATVSEVIKEMLARTWPFLGILLIQYTPLLIFGKSTAPGIIGFIAFFLVGFIPIMYIITSFTVIARHQGYLPTSIAVWAAFIISWLLAGTVPFVGNTPI